MKMMKQGQIISVNIGKPRYVQWRGRTVRTGIYKEPALGAIWISKENLQGDAQADLTVHGGIDQAVYIYPSEHYDFWREQYPELQLPWGMFGENLTTKGLLEDSIYSGDRFRIGGAELIVTKPRFPCYKLGMKFGTESIIKQFLESLRSGFYLSVLKEGYVENGDSIELRERAKDSVTIAEIVMKKAMKKSLS
jgi:MOSC domain-containing protein YiiM